METYTFLLVTTLAKSSKKEHAFWDVTSVPAKGTTGYPGSGVPML